MNVTTINNNIVPTVWNQDSLPSAPAKTSIDQSIQKIAKQALDYFSQAWNYVGKTIVLVRHTLNIIIRTPAWIAAGYDRAEKIIRSTTTKLKLFSIVGVLLDARSLPSKINTIWTNIKWKDKEGILLTTLSFTVMVADMFDSVTTFVNATLDTLSQSMIGWISTISIPFTLVLVGLSATLKVGNLSNLSSFSREFDRELLKIQNKHLSREELRSLLEPFMHKHLGSKDLDPSENEHRTEKTKRHTSNQILSELKELAGMLDNTASDGTANITKMIAQIRKSLQEEMALQAGSLLATIISGIASILFLVPTSGAAPFALLAVSMSLRIGMQAYQEWKANHKSTPATKS